MLQLTSLYLKQWLQNDRSYLVLISFGRVIIWIHLMIWTHQQRCVTLVCLKRNICMNTLWLCFSIIGIFRHKLNGVLHRRNIYKSIFSPYWQCVRYVSDILGRDNYILYWNWNNPFLLQMQAQKSIIVFSLVSIALNRSIYTAEKTYEHFCELQKMHPWPTKWTNLGQ